MAQLTFPTAGDLSVLSWRSVPERGSSLKRTLRGQLRGDRMWTARNWDAEVFVATDAEAAAIYTDADDGQTNRSISGDLVVGSPVTARIEVKDDQYVRDGNAHVRVISLRIREQV